MPATIQLDNVNWSFHPGRDETGEIKAMALRFHDGQIGAMIPFDLPAWENFKRHVAADGEISPLEVARVLPPNGVP